MFLTKLIPFLLFGIIMYFVVKWAKKAWQQADTKDIGDEVDGKINRMKAVKQNARKVRKVPIGVTEAEQALDNFLNDNQTEEEES